MPCPIEDFVSFPHIIESIFVNNLSTYADFQACKEVNSTWKRVLTTIQKQSRHSHVFRELKFSHDWFSKKVEPIELKVKVNVEISLVKIVNKWLFLKEDEDDTAIPLQLDLEGERSAELLSLGLRRTDTT